MTDLMQSFVQLGILKTNPFPGSSRYHMVETATLATSDGRTVVYLRRRFLPQPECFAMLQEHTVSQGDRLDNLAAHYLGDAEQFWQLCDANAVMRPQELTETAGRKLRITLPEGIQGSPNG